jgi:hypothetical protein
MEIVKSSHRLPWCSSIGVSRMKAASDPTQTAASARTGKQASSIGRAADSIIKPAIETIHPDRSQKAVSHHQDTGLSRLEKKNEFELTE